jgi:hypothetical protein
MNFKRPFRAELIGSTEIWIIDAADAFVTRFPRISADIQEDLTRANAIAAADTGEEFLPVDV